MTCIKIISNPYKQEIQYQIYQENTSQWVDVGVLSPNGRLREEKARKCFLPFYAKEILDIIVSEYYLENKGPVQILFEGTEEEFAELAKVCQENEFTNKIELQRSSLILDNGKYILNDAKDIFEDIKPVIEGVTQDEPGITKSMVKVSDALNDIIPICVFGNYSSGKSTFINALIGREVLPSGGDPVTAKAFKIQNSPQEDVAKIKFTHWDDAIELSFEGNGYRLLKGNPNDEMLKELDEDLQEKAPDTIWRRLSYALDFINAYEKRDTTSIEIGSMIELQVAFAKNGLLGTSSNKFVIFDTPGSNTVTNDDHIEALREALDGFSNGIPVWVSQFETIDTLDNDTLCNNILSIEALDKRFTMIILNKADVSDLPEHGFNEKQIRNIREFKSVEKMYASGIFFVSSIMGLGSKHDGKLLDKYYRKIYKLQYDSFTDPEDEDYLQLFQYNIMPEQIKQKMITESKEQKNTVYVNSGLFCIENEIETFASKYSAYNKCQMVYALLTDVVSKTTEKIAHRVEARKRLREKYKSDLEEKKQQLIQQMRNQCVAYDSQFKEASYEGINGYAKRNLNYDFQVSDIEALNEKYVLENHDEYQLDSKQQSFNQAVDTMKSNFLKRVKDFSITEIKDSLSNTAKDLKKDFETLYESKKELDSTQKSAWSETADEVLSEVIEIYRRNMEDATKKINHIACNYWENNSQLLKNKLIEIVTVSDALTDKQKENLSALIFNYKNISYDDHANSIFVKPKFLQGRLLGLNLFVYEKLNTNKLAKEYNRTVAENIESIANDMNENYHSSYQKWQDELSATIEKNIVELNPELQIISDSIDEETAKINMLETSQLKIRTSLNEIERLLSFKTITQ